MAKEWSRNYLEFLAKFIRYLPVDDDGFLIDDTRLRLAERLAEALVPVTNEMFEPETFIRISVRLSEEEFQGYLMRSAIPPKKYLRPRKANPQGSEPPGAPK